MSILKNPYQPPVSLSPRYIRIERDGSTGIIIIDDIAFDGTTQAHTEINRSVVWLKVETGFIWTMLNQAPSGVSAFSPSHGDWEKSRIFIQTSETYVIRYESLTSTTQLEATGYEQESTTDVLYLKIDQTANTVTVYQ